MDFISSVSNGAPGVFVNVIALLVVIVGREVKNSRIASTVNAEYCNDNAAGHVVFVPENLILVRLWHIVNGLDAEETLLMSNAGIEVRL